MQTIFPLIKTLTLATLGFIITIAWTPLLTNFLYRHKLGKKIRKKGVPIFQKFHKKKEGTPTMGGMLVWGTTAFLALGLWSLAQIFPSEIFKNLNFLTRGETLLPLGALILAGLVGLADDLLDIFKIGPEARGGLSMKIKILLYTLIAMGGAWWFYFKLDWDLFYIPLVGSFNIGPAYILVFIFIIVATAFSTNETDGLDGLAGGVLTVAFSSLATIAFIQERFNLTAFCGVIIGSLLAFLWFNIYPARFFMGDTGSMSLGVTLGVIAMLTNSALLLPFFGFILVVESGSVILQVLNKKFRNKKIFLSTPIHHHFEAKGWPETKVTMRFWVIAAIMASLGLILGLISYKMVPIVS